jgi:hypothetical protein
MVLNNATDRRKCRSDATIRTAVINVNTRSTGWCMSGSIVKLQISENMQATGLQQSSAHCVIEPSDWDDGDDLKDVFHPDFLELPGETTALFNLRFAFASNGYQARLQEAESHPVLIARLTRRTAPLIPDDKLFRRHIKKLLCHSGFPLRMKEMTVSRKGNSVLLVFPWERSGTDYAAALRQAEADAAEFEGMAP